jgi:hypothetical protein
MIFIAFCVGMGYVAMMGLADGAPEKLKYMYDADGKFLHHILDNFPRKGLWIISRI